MLELEGTRRAWLNLALKAVEVGERVKDGGAVVDQGELVVASFARPVPALALAPLAAPAPPNALAPPAPTPAS